MILQMHDSSEKHKQHKKPKKYTPPQKTPTNIIVMVPKEDNLDKIKHIEFKRTITNSSKNLNRIITSDQIKRAQEKTNRSPRKYK